MTLVRSSLLAAALAGAALTAAHAQSFSFDFDSIAAGTTANAYLASLGVTAFSFHQAYYIPATDEFGDDIPGTEHWEIDPANDADFPVLVDDPTAYGYGAAPSGTGALEALWQPVLIQFDQGYTLAAFSAVLDASEFGSLGPVDIELLTDFVGGSVKLALDQTLPGYLVGATDLGVIYGIVLPSGAFYDNLAIGLAPIPEPSTWAALAGGAALLGALVRRRVRRA